MFAIVAFDTTSETDYVPLKWLEGVDVNNIQLMITNNTSVKCHWPPFKNPNTVTKAKNNSYDAEMNWPFYIARVLGLANNLNNARQKAKIAEDTSSLENAFEETEESSGTFRKNKKRRVTKISYDRESENEDSENDLFHSVEPKKKMLANSTLVIKKPQQPYYKLSSNSKFRVDHQLQHDEHFNDLNIWNSEQFSPPIALTPECATSVPMLSSTIAASGLSQTANLQTIFNLITTLVSNVEEIKKTLKVHTSLLHSIKHKVRVNEEEIFDLPEDIKLPLTSIAEVDTLEEKLLCAEKKKILVL
ncbi:uncharacterized protein LOC124805796 isoform X3 [Hydra vulgaris]|uniref:uncharacterized protein LOC124805796 isoform X3 n=1 Tax=Hydra vulgaris TaxID=6087 RepID=UPI0032EA1E9B